MPPHSVLNPLAAIGRTAANRPAHPVDPTVYNPLVMRNGQNRTFKNPFKKPVNHNEKQDEKIILELTKAAARPVFNICINKDHSKLRSTIESIIKIYIPNHSEHRDRISEKVVTVLDKACKQPGHAILSSLMNTKDENLNFNPKLRKLVEAVKGGTRKSIRRKSKTRRHRR